MKPIVQCVPNFSEGRDMKTIEAIVEPLRNQTGFTCASVEPDQDYNRTVVTLIGDPEAMVSPLLEAVRVATERIDMNRQKGEHPRMGATDVVPFIPIADITMDDCVAIAHRFAEKLATSMHIPVFVYAEAAKQKGRVKLPAIRKGEYEGMAAKLQDPAWTPDFGPAKPHPTAGVSAVGARMPLIAYNIDLMTDNIDVAKRIAKAIRGSSGGFKHIQAGPVLLAERGHTQVTMNILNDMQNPVYRIFETVKMEARRDGVAVPSAEIVGLVPKATLVRSLAYYMACEGIAFEADTMTLEQLSDLAVTWLKFRDFTVDKIIEAHVD
ncbi:MAG: glutamate formimidoyltransferase [Acholeplasmatales bacterium]|nr:MAG: glutamate formimidoyltransferase [Acholeplasmatales bacterium]